MLKTVSNDEVRLPKFRTIRLSVVLSTTHSARRSQGLNLPYASQPALPPVIVKIISQPLKKHIFILIQREEAVVVESKFWNIFPEILLVFVWICFSVSLLSMLFTIL